MKSVDRQFKETFNEWEVQPNAVIWDKIAAELPSRPRRKLIAWWIFGAAGLAIIGLLLVKPRVEQNRSIEIYPQNINLPITNNVTGQATQEESNTPLSKDPQASSLSTKKRPTKTEPIQASVKNDFIADLKIETPIKNSEITPGATEAKIKNETPSATVDQPSHILPSQKVFRPVVFIPSINHELPGSDPVCPGFEKGRGGVRGGQWQLDIFGGPGYAFRHLTAKTTEGSSYLQAREREEHPVLAYMAGARLGYYRPIGLGRAIGLKAGVDMGRIVEKLAYSRDSILGTVTTIVIDSQQINGQWVINRDTVTTQRLGHLDREVYNRFTLIELPLVLSYQWERGPWLWQINGGATVQLAYKKQGYILDASDTQVSLNDQSASQSFTTQWGTQLWASVGLHRRISDRWYLFAEPTLRYQLKSLTTSTNLLDQRYLQVHLNLGAKIIF